MPKGVRNQREDNSFEASRKVFEVGTLTSFLLMVVGLGYAAITGATDSRDGRQPADLWSSVSALDPAAIVGIGVVVMLLTPVINVLVLAPLFARAKDYRFALVALLVLGVMSVSIALAVR